MTRTTFKTQKTVLPKEKPKATPAVALLTFRRSKTGNLLAAYRADVRVGYVCATVSSPWTWNLNLLQPIGGTSVGRAQSEQEAKDALLLAFKAWMSHAQLKEI